MVSTMFEYHVWPLNISICNLPVPVPKQCTQAFNCGIAAPVKLIHGLYRMASRSTQLFNAYSRRYFPSFPVVFWSGKASVLSNWLAFEAIPQSSVSWSFASFSQPWLSWYDFPQLKLFISKFSKRSIYGTPNSVAAAT